MDEEMILSPEDTSIIDVSEYTGDISQHFGRLPDVAYHVLQGAKRAVSVIEQKLYTAPALVNAVKAAVPEITLQAVLTDEQKKKIASGALKLMAKKDGSLLATIIDPKTNKIVTTVPLESVKVSPKIAQAMTDFSTQMQMAQLAEQIQSVQHAVEEIRMGQEYDRLATAYSCQQKLLQALDIKNPELRTMALMMIASSAEDSRNLLMLSQKRNVEFIKKQPEGFFQKIFSGESSEKINGRMSEIRDNLCAVNMASFVEAVAYQELGEAEAAKKSLAYYAGFIEETYTSDPCVIQRLDMIDPLPDNYWSKALPSISAKIKALPGIADISMLKIQEKGESISD